jgi:hypothetical protein
LGIKKAIVVKMTNEQRLGERISDLEATVAKMKAKK